MGQMKSIQLPTIFNVATYFVDRHITEGRAERVAYECGDERVTYRQLFERVNRAGNALKKLGVRQEERVGLLLLVLLTAFRGGRDVLGSARFKDSDKLIGQSQILVTVFITRGSTRLGRARR